MVGIRKCVQCGGTVPSDECTIESGDGFEVAICDKCHIAACLAGNCQFKATTDVRLINDTDIDTICTLWKVRVGDHVQHNFRYTCGRVTKIDVLETGRIIIHVVSIDVDDTEGMEFSDYSDRFEPFPNVCRTCGRETRRFEGTIDRATCTRCAQASDKSSEPQFTITIHGDGRKLEEILTGIGEGSFTVTVRAEDKS